MRATRCHHNPQSAGPIIITTSNQFPNLLIADSSSGRYQRSRISAVSRECHECHAWHGDSVTCDTWHPALIIVTPLAGNNTSQYRQDIHCRLQSSRSDTPLLTLLQSLHSAALQQTCPSWHVKCRNYPITGIKLCFEMEIILLLQLQYAPGRMEATHRTEQFSYLQQEV